MTKAPDYYAVLGVSAASDDVVIRAAFKALMLKYHPDTNKSSDATARAAAINEAFSVLGDPERRAAYDAARSDRATPPAPPPPPPSPPPSPDETTAASTSGAPRIAAKPGWISRIGGMIAVVLVGGLVRVAIQNINSASHSTGMASTSLGTGPAPVDMVADNIDAAADNMDAMADATQPTGFGGNAQALALPTASSESFTYQPPTSIDFKVIEGAGNTFAKIVTRKGLSGARAWSEDCHDKANKKPGWSEADRCAAFDYAASYMDQSMAKATNTSPNTYFAFETDNQADNCKAVGAMPFTVNDRLQHIRSAVEPATYEAVMAIINQREKSRPIDPATDGPTGGAALNQTGG